MEAYPSKLRELVLGAYAEGLKTKQVAERFKVSRSWARAVKRRLREDGSRDARAQAKHGPDPSLDPGDRRRLEALVARVPDATLAELRARLGRAVSASTVDRALAALGLTYKKRPSGRPSRTGPT